MSLYVLFLNNSPLTPKLAPTYQFLKSGEPAPPMLVNEFFWLISFSILFPVWQENRISKDERTAWRPARMLWRWLYFKSYFVTRPRLCLLPDDLWDGLQPPPGLQQDEVATENERMSEFLEDRLEMIKKKKKQLKLESLHITGYIWSDWVVVVKLWTITSDLPSKGNYIVALFIIDNIGKLDRLNLRCSHLFFGCYFGFV